MSSSTGSSDPGPNVWGYPLMVVVGVLSLLIAVLSLIVGLFQLDASQRGAAVAPPVVEATRDAAPVETGEAQAAPDGQAGEDEPVSGGSNDADPRSDPVPDEDGSRSADRAPPATGVIDVAYGLIAPVHVDRSGYSLIIGELTGGTTVIVHCVARGYSGAFEDIWVYIGDGYVHGSLVAPASGDPGPC